MGYARYSAVKVVAPGFPGTLRCAWVVTRCSSVLLLLILLSTFANSLSVQHVATLGIGIPCGISPPSSSCIPLSQCKSQAVCCRERLRVIVFGKIASLSLERASNCTNIQYFESVSKYSCMERPLDLSDRMDFHSIPYPSSIGFTVAKNTAFLPLLRRESFR